MKMKTQVTITMDQDVKQNLQIFAKEIGLNMSTLLNLSAKHLTSTRHLDFDFSTVMTAADLKAREGGLQDLENNTNFYTIKDLENA